MSRFVTGDLHFFHERIIQYCARPFAGWREMNDELEAQWNGHIGPSDEVYVLGDFALARPVHYYDLEGLFKRLPGTKHLLVGNHDRGAVLDLPWASVTKGHIEVDGVILTHDGKEYLDRRQGTYLPKELRPHERPVFQGHVHEVWRMRGNLLNCGVDVWHFRPVEWEQAKAYWASRFDYYKRTGQDA